MSNQINVEQVKKVLAEREAKNIAYMRQLNDSNALSGFTAKNLSEGTKAERVELAKLKGKTEILARRQLEALTKSERAKLNL